MEFEGAVNVGGFSITNLICSRVSLISSYVLVINILKGLFNHRTSSEKDVCDTSQIQGFL